VLVVVKEKKINFYVMVQLAAAFRRWHCAKPRSTLIYKGLLVESPYLASVV
jgi:hypothetical protein